MMKSILQHVWFNLMSFIPICLLVINRDILVKWKQIIYDFEKYDKQPNWHNTLKAIVQKDKTNKPYWYCHKHPSLAVKLPSANINTQISKKTSSNNAKTIAQIDILRTVVSHTCRGHNPSFYHRIRKRDVRYAR